MHTFYEIKAEPKTLTTTLEKNLLCPIRYIVIHNPFIRSQFRKFNKYSEIYIQ